MVRLMEEMMGIKVAVPQIMMDNRLAIALSRNPVLHGRSKHIKTKYHFIRECVEQGEICLEYVSTNDQYVDILTKPLAKLWF
jgi:hypothetical protein